MILIGNAKYVRNIAVTTQTFTNVTPSVHTYTMGRYAHLAVRCTQVAKDSLHNVRVHLCIKETLLCVFTYVELWSDLSNQLHSISSKIPFIYSLSKGALGGATLERCLITATSIDQKFYKELSPYFTSPPSNQTSCHGTL